MRANQVILANNSRLVREMLKHAINKNPCLEVVDVIGNPSKLPKVVKKEEPRWVVVSLSPEGDLPQEVSKVLNHNTGINILGMTVDGSQAKLKYITAQEESLDKLTLHELIRILISNRMEEILPNRQDGN